MAGFSNWHLDELAGGLEFVGALAGVGDVAVDEFDLGAVSVHDPAALGRFGRRHDQPHVVALGGADHRQPDPGVPAGGLDDGLRPGERTLGLGGLDHPAGGAVLRRAARVERLDLGSYGGAVRAVHLDQRRPDGLQDARFHYPPYAARS